MANTLPSTHLAAADRPVDGFPRDPHHTPDRVDGKHARLHAHRAQHDPLDGVDAEGAWGDEAAALGGTEHTHVHEHRLVIPAPPTVSLVSCGAGKVGGGQGKHTPAQIIAVDFAEGLTLHPGNVQRQHAGLDVAHNWRARIGLLHAKKVRIDEAEHVRVLRHAHREQVLQRTVCVT